MEIEGAQRSAHNELPMNAYLLSKIEEQAKTKRPPIDQSTTIAYESQIEQLMSLLNQKDQMIFELKTKDPFEEFRKRTDQIIDVFREKDKLIEGAQVDAQAQINKELREKIKILNQANVALRQANAALRREIASIKRKSKKESI